MTRPELEAERRGQFFCGYAHLAFRVGSAAMVDSLTQRLREDGYAVSSAHAPQGTDTTKAVWWVLKEI